MADNLRQIAAVVDTDRFTAKDFTGSPLSSVQVVNGDTILFAFHFQRANYSTGALEDLNLSAGGAPLALRFTCRATRSPSAATLTFQDTYNQGDLAAFEDLAKGQITFRVSFNDADIDTLLASADSAETWLEVTYLSAGSLPQTLYQRRLTIVQQLDNGAVGTPPPTSPTYLTATEIAAAYVANTLFDAYTMLYADTDNTPAALTIAASRIVGRKASGGIAALTGAEVAAIIGSMTPTAHNLLSAYHGDTTTAACVRGDVITGQGASPTWTRLAISVPGSGLMNYLGAANGDTEPGYKALFDATVPGTISPGASAAAGSATVAARRDHTHGAPATWAPSAHDLCSASHGDTLAAAVAAGDLLYGNATPKWAALAKGSAYGVLHMNAAGTLPEWTLTPSGLTSLAATTLYADHWAEQTSSHGLHLDHTVYMPAGVSQYLYNTADEVTDYERLGIYWDTNVAYIGQRSAGLATNRKLSIRCITTGAATCSFDLYRQAPPFFAWVWSASISTPIASFGDATSANASMTASSGVQVCLAIRPYVNQSSTAAYTAFLINPTENATGSGAKLLIDAQVGSASKFAVTNAGAVLIQGTQVLTTQQTALTAQLTTLTHTAPSTPDYAIQALTNSTPYGFVTADEGHSVLAVIANLQARVSELETKLKAHGLIA
jgi:hypothetical protein